MDYCIYHSKDLDGLTSGAVIFSHQKRYGDFCKLFGYDYGEKLDTRKFKGKATMMIDVSMPMDRMETLGKGCLEFTWVDHHLSAYNDLLKYCEENKYDIIRSDVNGLIKCIDVRKMNMIYYYSEKLSACEMAISMFARNLKENSRKLVSLLGQYDTWRNNREKMFTTDTLDWDGYVLPIQMAMREYDTPEKIHKILYELDSSDSFSLTDIHLVGKSILNYQKKQYEYQFKRNSFEFDLRFKENTYKVLAINCGGYSSMAFDGFYWSEIHDIMMSFQFNGKTGLYSFSMYTTKDVNILEIANQYGGGGHSQACGFTLPSDEVTISNKGIEFGSTILSGLSDLPDDFESFKK